MNTIPPALNWIRANANAVAPGRSQASDGILPDPRHVAQGVKSDHNATNGKYHAVDITNDPAHGMDTWHWANIIASRIIGGQEKRVKYLVSNDGQKDVIFNPSVGLYWRQNGAVKQEHRSHLHTSILSTTAAENDTSPYFVSSAIPPGPIGDDDMQADEREWLQDLHSAVFNGDFGKANLVQNITRMLNRGWNFDPNDRNSAAFMKITDAQEMLGAIRDGFAMAANPTLKVLTASAATIRKAADKILS